VEKRVEHRGAPRQAGNRTSRRLDNPGRNAKSTLTGCRLITKPFVISGYCLGFVHHPDSGWCEWSFLTSTNSTDAVQYKKTPAALPGSAYRGQPPQALSYPAQQAPSLFGIGILDIIRYRRRHARTDGPGHTQFTLTPVRADFDGETLREPDHAMLARRVGRESGGRNEGLAGATFTTRPAPLA